MAAVCLQEEQKAREAAEAALQAAQDSFKAELAATRDKFRESLAAQTEVVQSTQQQLQVSFTPCALRAPVRL